MIKHKCILVTLFALILTMLFSATSCMNRKETDTEVKNGMALADWTYTGEKKTEMTLDDFRAVVEECKALYAASPRIDYSVNGGEARYQRSH